MGDVVCFKCGQKGHPRAECPRGTPKRPDTPGPAQGAAPDGERPRSVGVPPRRPPEEIAADPHGHANRARRLLGIGTTCTDPECVTNSKFRQASRRPAIHECQLRHIARQQLLEQVWPPLRGVAP